MEYKKGIDGNSAAVGQVLAPDLQVHTVSGNLFRVMRQSSAMNKLATLKTTKLPSAPDEDDTFCIEKDNLRILFKNFSTLGGLKTTTHRLADALMIKFTESGSRERTVMLSVEEYMRLCELKNSAEVKKQIGSDLKTLLNMHLDFQKSSNREQSMQNIRLCTETRIRNNYIFFTFSEEFYSIMKTMPVMPYPEKLFRINLKRNPNSYYFLKKLSEHKKMNYFKKNADTISVRTLIGSTPELPTYEEVMETDRALTRRIIEPFERDMNELADVLDWEYCHASGTPLTDADLANFNYHVFSGLLVRIRWRDYPELKKKKRKQSK
ncbi:MAG: hypothetical protein J5753_05885 [Oscillospiraceae bacterium]|nr:hypothetical protein [Oscillospiraceae bacterium]